MPSSVSAGPAPPLRGTGSGRVVDTLIGSAVAVVAVLVSPRRGRRSGWSPTPGSFAALSRHPQGNRVCHQLGVDPRKAEAWRKTALGLVEPPPKPGRNTGAISSLPAGMQGLVRSSGARSRGRGIASRGKESPSRPGLSRALVDGASDAHPMPGVGAMLVSTASAIDAYAKWVASPGEPTDRRRLSDRFELRARRSAGQWSERSSAGENDPRDNG